MITLNPEEISLKNLQRTLQFAIGPRPIALVSSINSDGDVNLSPFRKNILVRLELWMKKEGLRQI